MKVLHILQGMQKASGVSSFVGGLASALCDQGVRVSIAANRLAPTVQYPIESRINFLDLTSLDADVIAGHNVVHIHGLWTWDLHKVSRWCDKIQMPVIWSPHGSLAPWAMKFKRWKKIPAWLLWQERDLRNAQMFHVTSSCEEQWVRELGFEQPCVIAPLGTTEKIIKVYKKSTRNTLLFVGRVYPVKALDRLIVAFSKIPTETRKNWRLRIVGPDQDDHMNDLKTLSYNLNVSNDVEFVGDRYGEDLEKEYASCDCLALVSHTENFGSTVIEALSYGKPCITSKFTPWRELQEYNCGWWVENTVETLSDTIKEMMLFSTEKRHNMGINGLRLIAEKYTWAKVAEALKKAYVELA